MAKNNFRNILALITLIISLGIIGFLIINQAISPMSNAASNDSFYKALDSAKSIFSGLIGIVLGYYFRGSDK